MKKVAIIQSNYIPWKGYFDIINLVDEFILYDDVQYTKRDWRNRNRIKTPNGLLWLTIPVKVKGKYYQPIKDVKIASTDWIDNHLKNIEYNYSRAKYYEEYIEIFTDLYTSINEKYLSNINYNFIKRICEILEINTKLSWSMDYSIRSEDNTEKLIEICKQAKATEYISGPAAKSYMELDLFEEENINVKWMEYTGYPEYEQLYPPFEHGVSILDLIFNEGPNATNFMKSF